LIEPMVIMVAPNGARKSRSDHAGIPLTASELADTAEACLEAGACALHLHVRDADGRHTLDPLTYREALDAIRGRVADKLLLQVTTEAVGLYSAHEQIEIVRALVPEAVSLSVRELAAAGEAAIGAFDRWMRERDVLPQWILYSLEDLGLLNDWIERGVLAGASYPVLFVLGKYSPGLDATPAMLEPFLDRIEGHAWMVCAFGSSEGAIMRIVADAGGHARIGFENNLLDEQGMPAADNATLVRPLVHYLQTSARRPLATASQARGILRPRW
jgi:3-keto-5-aminohexanoate cleavage enzyme